MSPVTTEENPLWLTRCMRCGYCLETLAPEGTCPECGIAYDQQTIVLSGTWSGNGGIATGSTGAIVAYLGVGAFIGWMMYSGGNHAFALAVAIFVGPSLCAEFVYRLYARRAGVGSALSQCRFNRFGCIQCDLPEEIIGMGDLRAILRWVTLGGFVVLGSAYAWAGARHGQWIWATVIPALCSSSLITEWQRRRAIRRAQRDPDGRVLMTAARSSGSQVPATPWSAIAEIRVGQFRGKSDRWYLTSVSSKSGSKGAQAINAEVEATPDRIRELKAWIAYWISAARIRGDMKD
ncbi:MAG TPA: hypothetical protein VGI81_17030 [Tepidisphaeraceae bacterium]|jgi:hypothetical protein